jgi:hypothetical protein
MKTKFLSNDTIELTLNNCSILVTCEQMTKINAIKNWYFDDNFEYPYYIISGSPRINCQITDFLFGKFIELAFKDNNKYNLKEDNIIITDVKHYANDYVKDKYNVEKYIQGHISKKAIYNPIWQISNNNDKYYLMYCEKNVLIKLYENDYLLLQKFNTDNNYNATWFNISDSIKSRLNNTSVNIVSIIKNFGKSRIIKMSEENNQNNELNESNYNNDEDNLSAKDLNDKKINEIESKIKDTMNVIKIKKGHVNQYGVHAGLEKNRIWKIKDDDKIIYLMYCEPNTLCILNKDSLKKIRAYEKENYSGNKITWFKHSNGYIHGTCSLYIHQVITGCYGNGRGTMDISVDHIDQNPLNNCFDNLRVATREEQQANTKSADGERRERKHNAKPLPEGLTNSMMKKYVVYYSEKYGKDNNCSREFFKIEKHPKLTKPWISSKSNKVTLIEKLKAANDMVDSLNAQNNDEQILTV